MIKNYLQEKGLKVWTSNDGAKERIYIKEKDLANIADISEYTKHNPKFFKNFEMYYNVKEDNFSITSNMSNSMKTAVDTVIKQIRTSAAQ